MEAACLNPRLPGMLQAAANESAAVQQACAQKLVTCGQSRRMELLRAHLVQQRVILLLPECPSFLARAVLTI